MNATVVDCSALAAVAFEEDDGQKILALLDDRRLIAPALLPFELASVCTTKVLRHAHQRSHLVDQFVAVLGRVRIELLPVGFHDLPELASRYGLSAYDAAYLWLALAERAPLVTLDLRLQAAYRKAIQ